MKKKYTPLKVEIVNFDENDIYTDIIKISGDNLTPILPFGGSESFSE